jgi:coenzyme PQQ precursor peptide PqqA
MTRSPGAGNAGVGGTLARADPPHRLDRRARAGCRHSKRRLAARSGRYAMAWTKPVITETPCGAEINLYVSAEI